MKFAIPGPGERISVATGDHTVEGVVMPRPVALAPNIIVLKLANGYNIGISHPSIQKITVLEKATKKELPKNVSLPEKKGLPTVSILSVGGTISSRIDYQTGGVSADLDANDFVRMWPELGAIANIRARRIASMMSENATWSDWSKIATGVAEELNNGADGVVVTHGTDTMHFTSAVLSFFLPQLGKPVILTGSQRSIDRGSSDAFLNLACSVVAAARFDGGLVGICMHGTAEDNYCILNRGVNVRKMHTSRRDAFRSINERPIAKIFSNGKIETLHTDYPKRGNQKAIPNTVFEEKVAIVHIYPGMDPGVIDYYLEKGYKGLILNATALGHVPMDGPSSLAAPLRRAQEKKIPIVITTQTIYGATHPYVYSNLRLLSIQYGCIFANTLTEVAYLKLGWLLGHSYDYERVKKEMLTNYCGEIHTKIDTESFLI